MKTCDTCGKALSDDDPFVVCRSCLFAGALSEPPGPAAPATAPPAPEDPDRPAALSSAPFTERYEIQERLNQGGQGEILKVWDLRLRRSIAMKRLMESDDRVEQARSRFLAEAQIAGQLQHPGILPVHDLGRDLDGRLFYTTDLLPGTTLRDRIRDTLAIGTDEARNRTLELLIRVCDIVAHAHSRGVIHRDLKPENVLVGAHGDLRVIDWGSAHVSPEARRLLSLPPAEAPLPPVQTDRSLTLRSDPESPLATARSGQPITALFTPPEILGREAAGVEPTADVYAVGIMLYEVCAGRMPYSDEHGRLPDAAELRRRIRAGPPTRLHVLRPDLPRDLVAVCEKASARQPADRYAEIAALAADLRAFLEVRPVAARPPGVVGVVEKWVRRHARLVAVGSAVLALVAFLSSLAIRSDTERQRAALQRDRAVVEGQQAAVRAEQAEIDRRMEERVRRVRECDNAAQSGRWRDALAALDELERSGYHDRFDLALRRYAAWVVLWEPERARAELDRMDAIPDLPPERRALALLRRGEFELFDGRTAEAGVGHIRAALELGLPDVEAGFARGILAPTTAEALRLFRETLNRNPFHHGAHRHALGLEMLTGDTAGLEAHVRVFHGLFPGDPTPGLAEALTAAFRGDAGAAESALARAGAGVTPETLRMLRLLVRLFVESHPLFDVTFELKERTAPPADVDALLMEFVGVLPMLGLTDTRSLVAMGALPAAVLSLPLTGPSQALGVFLLADSPKSRLQRLPQLPCLRTSEAQAHSGLGSLLVAGEGADLRPALANVRASWATHREALVPFAAAKMMEFRTVGRRARDAEFLGWQADLHTMAAESSSVIPTLPKLSRFLAAKAHLALVRLGGATNAAACLAHIRAATTLPGTSRSELAIYCRMALELHDVPLSAELLSRWERAAPADPRLDQARIDYQIAAEAFGPARRLLEVRVARSPDDERARQQLEQVKRRIRELSGSPASAEVPPGTSEK